MRARHGRRPPTPALAAALIVLASVTGPAARAQAPPPFGAPVLKWQRGGCFTSFCQTGWYASPAVADLDGDGQPEVIWGSYDVVALSGANGALDWRASSGQRVWPGVAVADLTGDGTLEVIVGRGGDQATVYDRNGGVVWTRNPFGSGEVRTLAVEDLERDGQLEVIVGRASGGQTKQLNVYEPDGTARAGWPARRDGELGNGWGMYNENVAVGDMDGDGFKEIFGPTDTHYITALDRGGNQLGVNSRYAPRQVWSEVGVHVDDAVDLRGYAECGTEHRPNFANSAPVIGDVNGDGVPEMVVVGNVYNCGTDPYTDLYEMPFILKLDRTRWSGGGFDWTSIPTPGPGSAPLSEDYTVIENNVPNPVLADLDGDGFKEILFPSYDGKMHAYWLDKTERGQWPYDIPGAGIRFASEPVVADLDGDGKAEVIFTSWPEKVTGRVGQLHVLDDQGRPLFVMDLPAPTGGATWNGALGAPTLANIDSDADLELVVGTVATGVVAYDLPGTAGARILWGTGRGSFKRTGAAAPAITVSIDDRTVAEGAAVNAAFRLTLSAPSSQAITVDYATADGTATAGTDYQSRSGTVTFSPGRTTHSILVPIQTDAVPEGPQTFTVSLSNPVNAVLGDGLAAGIIADPPAPAKVPMYRAYSRQTDYHFFTTELASKNFAVSVLGFQDESNPIPFSVWNVLQTDAVPLFRMYNPNLGRHYYTADVASRDFLMGIGMSYEKDEGFLYPLGTTPPAGTTELFRLYNNNSGTHLFTADAAQKDGILNLFPGVWIQHTSVGYVFATPNDVVVTVVGNAGSSSFSPPTVTVAVGQRVAWRNADFTAHTATADGGGFDTGTIAPGATSTPITMLSQGSFPYHCSFHPGMVGTVTVTP